MKRRGKKRRGTRKPGRRAKDPVGDWRVRFERAKERLRDAGVPALIEALKRGEAAASAAARQLIEGRPLEAVPALIQALRDPSPEARDGAARALASIASGDRARRLLPGAVPALVALQDPDGDVRAAARAAIEEIESLAGGKRTARFRRKGRRRP